MKSFPLCSIVAAAIGVAIVAPIVSAEDAAKHSDRLAIVQQDKQAPRQDRRDLRADRRETRKDRRETRKDRRETRADRRALQHDTREANTGGTRAR